MSTSNTAPQPGKAPQTSGSARVRVRYCECDPMGVVHHAAYIPWLEIGRTELLRGTGVTYAQLEQAGVFLVVVKLECRYRRPAYYDDLVEVRTKVVGGSRVKIEHEYELVVVESGRGVPAGRAPNEVLLAASSTLACVGKDGKVQTLPDWLAPR